MLHILRNEKRLPVFSFGFMLSVRDSIGGDIRWESRVHLTNIDSGINRGHTVLEVLANDRLETAGRTGLLTDDAVYRKHAERTEFERYRHDAGEMAIRIFRFRARRGIGVFYGSFSILVMASFLLDSLFNSLVLLGIVWIAGGFAVWYLSRISGFVAFGRMEYTMSLLEDRETERERKGRVAIIRTYSNRIWPWLVFIILLGLGYVDIAVWFPLIWVILMFVKWHRGFSKKGSIIVEFKTEDWVFSASLAIAAFLVIFPGIGLEGFVFALPFFTFASLRSLYSAPEEFLFEYEGE